MSSNLFISYEIFAQAKGAIRVIFETIWNETVVNKMKRKDLKLDKIDGNIEFSKVNFRYPSRPTVLVSLFYKPKLNLCSFITLS